MNNIYLDFVSDYDKEKLTNIIRTNLDKLDVFKNITEESNVFIKLNCVAAFDSSMCITTNPVILDSVIGIVKEYTKNITIGDNPATKDLLPTLKKCGLYDVIVNNDCKILDQKDVITIKGENCSLFSEFTVSRQMVDADLVINLPKVKCHSLTYMSCAEKNFFGLIYGLNKSAWHVKASNPKDFASLINDLYKTYLDHLGNNKIVHICDGIVALEGDGPSTGGTPHKMNALIMGRDAIACDLTACDVAHLNRDKLSITQNALERGIGGLDYKVVGDFNLFTETLEEPKKSVPIKAMKILKIKALRNVMYEHPVIDKDICIKCGECSKICPPKAMQFEKGVGPYLKKKSCIRCWCCAEVCPKNAISKSNRPLIGRILLK